MNLSIMNRLSRGNIQFIIGLLIVLVTTIIFTGFAFFTWWTAKNKNEKELRQFTSNVASRLATNTVMPLWNLDEEAARASIKAEMLDKRIYAIIVKKPGGDGIILGQIRNEEWEPVDTDQEAAGDYWTDQSSIVKDEEELGLAEVYVTDRFLRESLFHSVINIMLAGLGAVVVLCLILILSIRVIILKPLRRMSEAAGKVAAGELNVEYAYDSTNEIGLIGRAFARLTDIERNRADLTQRIARGDLTTEVELLSEADVFGLALKEMTRALNEIMLNLNSTTDRVARGSAQISESSNLLSVGASEQAASLEEISSSMTQVGSQTSFNADNAQQADILSKEANKAAEKGNEQMNNMIAAMNDINISSREIGKIIKAIDDIAFQTNLLALNAAVEAARAGRHGKGFAVVAQEVRNLASRSAKAARETSELIEEAMKNIENGSEIVSLTADSLKEIMARAAKVTDLVSDIAAASNEQKSAIIQINQGLNQVEQVTTQNTASAEQTASMAEELADQARFVRQLVSKFKLNQDRMERDEPGDIEEPPAITN